MQHNISQLKIFLKKCSTNLNNLEPIINKCLFSSHDLLAIVPASSLISELQIKSAIEKAYNSFFFAKPISKSLSIEFLLYLYATRKISEALNIVAKKDKYYFVVIASKSKERAARSLRCIYASGFRKADFKLKPNVKKLAKLYKITWLNAYKGLPREKALELAVIEKQALLRLSE
jgi:tRNA threonylcarbamoyladenosine modification (KEOPS) complex Cgi121 subunit